MAHDTKSRAPDLPTDRNDLTRRYGKIGISAVAAALRYSEAGKEPAHSDEIREDERPRRHEAA